MAQFSRNSGATRTKSPPTMVIKKAGYVGSAAQPTFWWWKVKYSNWGDDFKKWLNDDCDLPNPIDLISVRNENGKEWIILAGHPVWQEPKEIGFDRWSKPFKHLWYSIESFLIPGKKFVKFKKWVISQEFDRSWVPDNSERYEVFSREFYWSPAYEYFQKEYYGGMQNHEIYDYPRQKKVCEIMTTINKYLWEAEFDKSKDDTIRFLKPSKHIFDKMGLEYSANEGEFLNKQGELICFDPSVYSDSPSFLLINKDAFIKYLEENESRLLWVVYGEKNIMYGTPSPPVYYGRQDIIGIYYFNDRNEIDGIQFSKKNQ